MTRRFGERLAAVFLWVVCVLTLVACERDASGLTAWTVADHDHQDEVAKRRAAAPAANPRGAARTHAPPSQRNQVIDVTWLRQCASCHGKQGRGDGPQSPMVKARDLSNFEWQATVSDEQLAKVIRQGKDKMPAFDRLPESVVEGLVAHVRDFGEKARARAQGAAGAEGAAGERPTTTPASTTEAPAPAAGPSPTQASPAPKP